MSLSQQRTISERDFLGGYTIAGRRPLFLIAGPFVLALLLGVGCQESYQPLIDEGREPGATIRLTNFQRQSVRRHGVPEWLVRSKEAYIFIENDEQQRIVVYDFVFDQYTGAGIHEGSLTAERGEINHVDDQLVVSGDIHYAAIVNRRAFKAETMRFELSSRILTSDGEVEVIEGDLVTRCRDGIRYETEEDRLTCFSPYGVREVSEAPAAGGAGAEERDDSPFGGLFQ